MKLAAALLLAMFSSAALAEWWRADMESGSDATGLVILVSLGIGYFYCKRAFASSFDDGMLAVVICAAITVGAVYIPIVKVLLALLTLWFLVSGIFNRR